MTYIIEAEGLVKKYGKTIALDGVDLAVRPGTVLGVLGPNGAGKTT
jgi:oleandomycin transport system ATP-binding protein